MKLRTVKKTWVMFRVNHLLSGTRAFERKRRLLNSIGHEIGEGTRIVGPLFCTGQLHVGKDCWLGADLTVHGNGSVFIGDNCDLAPGVMFVTGSHAIGGAERRAGAGNNRDIHVGSGCWLGARTTLLGGVTLGSGSVVAACGCVAADIPDNTLVGGVPAKTIRELKP